MPSKTLYSVVVCLFAGFTGYATAQNVPRSSHVWMITEENHSFEDVIGNPDMPYYNQLAQQYGLATQFYANQHSSLPALMWLVAGASVERNNNTTSCHHDQDNIIRELLNSGYTWRSYQDNLPYAGFQGLYGSGNLYYRRHNPLIDFKDACPGTGQETNSVPYSQMAADWADNTTVNYAYITPGPDADAHNGTLADADQWLQTHVPDILARPEFQPGGDGILFIVWDEGSLYTDHRCSATKSKGCGGRTANLVIGPQVKSGYQSTTLYHNENVLKTVCVAMGLSTCPGAAQDAAPMADFFSNNYTPGGDNGVLISSPGDGATVAGQVHLMASASESKKIAQTQVWDNGSKLGVYGSQIDQVYSLAPGQHTLSVVDFDSDFNAIHKATVNYTVEALTEGVQIISPTPGQNLGMATVNVVAHASESVPVTQVQVWDNGTKLGWYPGTDVNQYYTLDPGSHAVTVLDLDSNYNIIHLSTVLYTVQ